MIKFCLYQRSYFVADNFRVSLPGLDAGAGSGHPNYFVLIVNEKDIRFSASSLRPDFCIHNDARYSPEGTKTESVLSDDFSPMNLLDRIYNIEGIIGRESNLGNFWKQAALGQLHYQNLTLEPLGPQWSQVCSIEHGGKAEVITSNCCFSVSTRFVHVFAYMYM